ncbi:MAG: hypothetical protein OEU92_29905 [Alphaproteobacteria bacterium]|nr:hypothetical protein [Alphaproteobacteria bacterium]
MNDFGSFAVSVIGGRYEHPKKIANRMNRIGSFTVSVLGGLERCTSFRRCVGASEFLNGALQPFAVTKRKAELAQIMIGQVRNDIRCNIVLGKEINVSPEA